MRAVHIDDGILTINDHFDAPQDTRERHPKRGSRAGCAIRNPVLNPNKGSEKNPVAVKLHGLAHPCRIERGSKATPHNGGSRGVHRAGHGFSFVRVSDQERKRQIRFCP
jgi:hypothetical protein